MRTLIQNGVIVTAADTYRADILIEGGRIATIGQGLQAETVINAAGKYVFPGFIDPHVHMALPVGGLVSSDDFATGTIAAACGGTTTIIDFITPERGQSLAEAAELRQAEADGRVAVDYSLHLTAVDARPRTLTEVADLATRGYTSLKLYTTYPALMVDDGQMLHLLATAQQCGILPIVHTENHHMIAYLQAELLAAGKTAPRYHPLSRPPRAEAEAAHRVLALAAIAGSPLYIVHLTCRETLAAVEWARAAGQEVYAEVCPHHLLLSQDDCERPGIEGAKYVCSPPLRDKANWEPLWRALAEGRLQTVATDHCPWNVVGQKDRGRDDFTRIPNGTPGVETRVPLLYSEGVGKGRITLNRFVDACATAPARLFGLYPRKGTIAVGSDADLVIYDPEREMRLSRAHLHMNVDYSPYEEFTVQGYPAMTLLRGQIIARDNEFVGTVGGGAFLKRARFGC